MQTTIYFDMDGTIADLYNVKDWLSRLRQEDETPYIEAKPMINAILFQTLVNTIKHKGYKVGVITWTSKGARAEYNKRIAHAKKQWLRDTFPHIVWDEIHIIKYGINKSSVAFNPKGILFDDNTHVRNEWHGVALPPEMIEKTLKSL